MKPPFVLGRFVYVTGTFKGDGCGDTIRRVAIPVGAIDAVTESAILLRSGSVVYYQEDYEQLMTIIVQIRG